MLGKAFLLAGLLVSTGANATTPLNQTGTDPSGAAIDKPRLLICQHKAQHLILSAVWMQ